MGKKFEIDSQFKDVKYEIKDKTLIIRTKENGVLSIACENVGEFCDEIKYIAKYYKNSE